MKRVRRRFERWGVYDWDTSSSTGLWLRFYDDGDRDRFIEWMLQPIKRTDNIGEGY